MKNWDKDHNEYITDEKAFIFDLDKNEKYDIVESSKAIWSGSGYGPVFGYIHDLRLSDDFF